MRDARSVSHCHITHLRHPVSRKKNRFARRIVASAAARVARNALSIGSATESTLCTSGVHSVLRNRPLTGAFFFVAHTSVGIACTVGSKTYSGCFFTEVDLWCEYCCSHAQIGPHGPKRLARGARARRRRASSWGAARSVSSSGLLAGGVPQSARPCSACVRARGWSAGGCRVHTCASA